MKNQLQKEIERYLEHCVANLNLTEKTTKAYRTDLSQFSNYCKFNNVVYIEEVDKILIMRYFKNCNGKYKISSVKRKQATVKAFFKNYEFEHDGFSNPFRTFRQKFKLPKRLPTVLTLKQVDEYLRNLHRKITNTQKPNRLLRDLLVIEILFQTGIRVSELAGIKSHHVNIKKRNILISGKGRKQRYVYISSQKVLDLMNAYMEIFHESILRTGYFFINNQGRRLSDQSIRHIVKRHNPFTDSIHITPHIFRHTCATLLLESGLNLRAIQNLLGHASITTTQIYTHVSDIEMAKALAKYHPRNLIE